MIVAFTGHRPDKLGGYASETKHPAGKRAKIERALATLLGAKLQPTGAISGMALGVDQWAAWVCSDLGIPWIAAVPFDGQESRWPTEAQRIYHTLLARAYGTKVVTPGRPLDRHDAALRMQARNQWMVDHCQLLIAVFDGSPGGTKNCVDYALRVRREIRLIDPTTL